MPRATVDTKRVPGTAESITSADGQSGVYFQIRKTIVVLPFLPSPPMDSASSSAAALKLEIARLSGEFTQGGMQKVGLMNPD